MAKDIFQKIAEAPASALDNTLTKTGQVAGSINAGKTVTRTKQYWHNLGPGLTTGPSDDDPSGIATYSQAGAQYGFQLLWLSIITFPLMAFVQEMCARIGLVTQKGLAGTIKTHYKSKVLLYFLALLIIISFNFACIKSEK